MIVVHTISPTIVERLEPILKPFVDRLNRRVKGEWTWPYIRDRAQGEIMTLWLGSEGKQPLMLVGTELDRKPGGLMTMDIMFAAGTRVRDVFDPMMDAFMADAEKHGARLRVLGRTGWEPMMRKKGLAVTGYFYELRG